MSGNKGMYAESESGSFPKDFGYGGTFENSEFEKISDNKPRILLMGLRYEP